MKIKGIISAERACECCGNSNLEKNVVLETEAGELMYVGTSCASKLLGGKGTRKEATAIASEAKARSYAAKWTGIYGTDAKTLEKIASAVRLFYPATVSGDKIVMPTAANPAIWA